jgi:amino acid adenylation domain-containing protein
MRLEGYLSRVAAARPEAIALAMGEERVSYGELELESDGLARLLVDQGVRPGDRVCLLTGKSPAAVMAMHGVLKAGAAYVPLDVDSPAARTERIVRSADPALVLAAPDAAELLGELVPDPAVRVGSLGDAGVEGGAFSRPDWLELDSGPLPAAGGADAMAHVLFTSGSTGEPKGVVIEHRNVTAFLDWAAKHFAPRPTDRISGHPPLHFDLSTFDVFGTLRAGAELHLVPAAANMHPRALAAFIRDAGLTQWFSVPSVLTYLSKFDVVAQGDFPSLERLLWCGEVLPTPVLGHWMDRLPHVRFTNLYGPTEATIASSFHDVARRPADEREPVPIGTACDGEELLLLDEEDGVGEIGISGAGLSPGYWRDDQKTAQAFVPDPRDPGVRVYRTGDLGRVDGDGAFHFLGRRDSQIKSRGYRIELGEVETAVNAVGDVRECAVVGIESGDFEGTAICCAYAASGMEPTELRSQLTDSLPRYMLPSRWLPLDELPKNVNGKIDRRRLGELFEDQAAG